MHDHADGVGPVGDGDDLLLREDGSVQRVLELDDARDGGVPELVVEDCVRLDLGQSDMVPCARSGDSTSSRGTRRRTVQRRDRDRRCAAVVCKAAAFVHVDVGTDVHEHAMRRLRQVRAQRELWG